MAVFLRKIIKTEREKWKIFNNDKSLPGNLKEEQQEFETDRALWYFNFNILIVLSLLQRKNGYMLAILVITSFQNQNAGNISQ